MADRRSFEEMMNEIKESGDKERETIEVAEKISKVIGDLTRARIKKGLSQRQLAEKTGIKQSAIARMESIQAIPRLDTIIKVARCLDVEIGIEETTVKETSIEVTVPRSWNYELFAWWGPATNARINVSKPVYAGGYYGTGC